jgi:hypothetical protein
VLTGPTWIASKSHNRNSINETFPQQTNLQELKRVIKPNNETVNLIAGRQKRAKITENAQ